MRKRRVFAFFLALFCLIQLTACSGGDEFSDETYWYDQREPQEEQGESAGLLTSFALPYHAGESLDPITCDDGIQFQLTGLLYEPLFVLDETFTPQNWVCDSYTVSEDGLTYSFHIRSGVMFSDGTALNAYDAAATLQRARNSQRYGARFSEVSAVYASTDDIVTVTLTRPNSSLPALLSIPIVKRGTESNEVPVGSGPYLYITDGDAVYLQANTAWWKGETIPVRRIQLVAAKDTETVQHLFSSKSIHLFAGNLIEKDTMLGRLDCTDIPTTVMQYIGVNTSREKLSSAAVRRAVSAGIQRDQLVDNYLSGHGLAASFPISPAAAVYPADLVTEYSYEVFYGAASEAGLTAEDPLSLTLLVNEESPYKVSMAESIAKTVSVFGLSVTVRAVPWETYTAALAAGEFDLYMGEVRLRPDWDLTALLGTGGSLNYGGWSNVETDRLLRTGGGEKGIYDLCAHLKQQAPIIPLCFMSDSLLTAGGTVKNPTPTAGNLFYQFWDWDLQFADGAEEQTR